MKELSEIVHRGRKNHLIKRTVGQIKDWNAYEVTDILGINSDDVPVNNGLQYHPTIIILHHLQFGIEESDQPGENNASTGVEVSPVVSLDSLVNTIQRRHHVVRSDHIVLSNDCAIHDFGLECAPLFLSPLADPALGTDCRHDSAKINQQDFAKDNPENILVRVQQKLDRITAVKGLFQKYRQKLSHYSPTNNPNIVNIFIS
jgi:hypothetical protein